MDKLISALISLAIVIVGYYTMKFENAKKFEQIKNADNLFIECPNCKTIIKLSDVKIKEKE